MNRDATGGHSGFLLCCPGKPLCLPVVGVRFGSIQSGTVLFVPVQSGSVQSGSVRNTSIHSGSVCFSQVRYCLAQRIVVYFALATAWIVAIVIAVTATTVTVTATAVVFGSFWFVGYALHAGHH